MRKVLYILTILLLIFGCKNASAEKGKNTHTLKMDDKVKVEPFVYKVFKTDSVSIDVKNDNFNFYVILAIGNHKREYDLTKLNIPVKTPDEVEWANCEYACMMTWWSQSQSRHIFIPTNRKNELIYIDKVIEETDSINNNVVYIDSVYDNDNKVVFKVENLLTRKSKALELSINEQNSDFPYFEKIILTKNKLTMATVTEKKSIDIKEINNGL